MIVRTTVRLPTSNQTTFILRPLFNGTDYLMFHRCLANEPEAGSYSENINRECANQQIDHQSFNHQPVCRAGEVVVVEVYQPHEPSAALSYSYPDHDLAKSWKSTGCITPFSWYETCLPWIIRVNLNGKAYRVWTVLPHSNYFGFHTRKIIWSIISCMGGAGRKDLLSKWWRACQIDRKTVDLRDTWIETVESLLSETFLYLRTHGTVDKYAWKDHPRRIYIIYITGLYSICRTYVNRQ